MLEVIFFFVVGLRLYFWRFGVIFLKVLVFILFGVVEFILYNIFLVFKRLLEVNVLDVLF